jgi:hypothetical protein
MKLAEAVINETFVMIKKGKALILVKNAMNGSTTICQKLVFDKKNRKLLTVGNKISFKEKFLNRTIYPLPLADL